ncbi:MAG TPA: type II toxin-antitoxin system RelE/ParE family toxin [Pirellulaceae bacterium]|nr:type II toxin-antitoxin system RelE/ParE family toxin [Pirellulaceae bacterium]
MTSGRLYSLRIKRSAEKEMDSLPTSVFDRIAESIRGLETDPRPHSSRKLRGLEQYRLRVGVYRILYTVDDSNHIVEIIAVGHRKDVYR